MKWNTRYLFYLRASLQTALYECWLLHNFLCTIHNPAGDPNSEKFKQNEITCRKAFLAITFCTAIMFYYGSRSHINEAYSLSRRLDPSAENDYDLQGRTWDRETLKVKSYLQEVYRLLQFSLPGIVFCMGKLLWVLDGSGALKPPSG